jgi:glycosyltransferase involved in cell wall biosynthesis
MSPLSGAPVRACMLSFYFHPSYSGSAVQAKNLSQRLRERGVEPMLVSANLTASASREYVDGLELNRLRVAKAKDLQIPSFWLALAWFLWQNRNRIDLIHAHGTFQHVAASLIGQLLRKPTILKIAMGHSDIAFHAQGRVWGRINRFFVRRFDCYIATSEDIRRECLARGLDSDRIRLIPNGVDTDRFHPPIDSRDRHLLRRELGLADVPTVSYVGVVDARKNLDGILRIWKSVRERTDAGQLVIVGPRPRGNGQAPDAFHEELMRYIAKHALGDSVIFAGEQKDVAVWLRASDVFLFPSKREGMPNALLEAIASGLACVASKIGGSVDIIRHGEDGFLFNVEDESQMAASVAKLLDDAALRATIGSAARNRALTDFSLHVVAARYVELYAQLLEPKSQAIGRH